MSTTHFKLCSPFLERWPTLAITIHYLPPPHMLQFHTLRNHPLLFSFWPNNWMRITTISYIKQKPSLAAQICQYMSVLTALSLDTTDHYRLHSHCLICKVKELWFCRDKVKTTLCGMLDLHVVWKKRNLIYMCLFWGTACGLYHKLNAVSSDGSQREDYEIFFGLGASLKTLEPKYISWSRNVCDPCTF